MLYYSLPGVVNIFMLFAGWEGRIVKNCDLGSGLKNVIFIAWCGEYTCIYVICQLGGPYSEKL